MIAYAQALHVRPFERFHGALGQAYYRGIQAQPLRSNCFSMNFLAGLSMKISHFICNVNIKTPELPRAEAPGRFGFLALAWMDPQYTPGRVSSYILGKDEVTGSNPVISSRNQSEMAGFFVVWGWVRRNGRSILRFVDLHPSGAGVVSFSVSFFAL
ncbi:MAG TPA: hypothetical protein IAA71_00125 [Candidatus Pullichristensenella stercoripullorum]|nr:hypothetical protein [Candidatus Pullichristensenella stercoripullorum]